MVQGRNPEVLLVEDNATDAEMTLRAMRGKGLEGRFHVVRDGAEALDFLFSAKNAMEEDPRLILLDLRLPRIDGIEVLRRVKADPRTRTIPVVVFSSSRQDPDIRRCYELGANSYIVKPMDFEEFSVSISGVADYWLQMNQSP